MFGVYKKWLGGQSICSWLEKHPSRSHFNTSSIILWVRSTIPRWADSKNRKYRRIIGEPESAPVDRPLHPVLLQKIKGVKPPCLLDNNLDESLQESLQGHVFYENAECNFLWPLAGPGRADLLVLIASGPLSSNSRCCCKKQCNLSLMGRVRDLPLFVSRFA